MKRTTRTPEIAPAQIEGAAVRADRFAVDEDEFRIGFSIPFHDRDELPFSVQPAILLKVDLMSIIAIRSELDTSLLMMG